MLFSAVIRFADDLVLNVQVDEDGELSGTFVSGETTYTVTAEED